MMLNGIMSLLDRHLKARLLFSEECQLLSCFVSQVLPFVSNYRLIVILEMEGHFLLMLKPISLSNLWRNKSPKPLLEKDQKIYVC